MLEMEYRRIRVILPVLFKLLFELLYIFFISKTYSFFGTYLNINYIKIAISWMAFFLLLLGTNFLVEDQFKCFFQVMLYLSIIPSFSVFGLKNGDYIAFILIVAYWFVFLVAFYVVQHLNQYSCIKGNGSFLLDGNDRIVWLLFIWSVLSSIYLWFRYGGMRLFVSFSDVYNIRNAESSMRGYERYLLGWNTSLLIPACIYIFGKSRQYIRCFVCIVLMLLSYSIYANKTMVFTVFLVIGILFLSFFHIEAATDIMVGLFLFVYMLFSMVIPRGMILALAHRLLVVPAEAHYYYYDFFQTHELLYLRQSILRHLFANPYNEPVSMVIGSTSKYFPSFMPGDIHNLNNGLFSDAYQNFGVFGVFVYPILITGILYLFFRASDEFDIGFQFVFIVLSALYLISAYYFSWLLSGGVILLLIGFNYMKNHYDNSVLNGGQV